ncbi:MAG: L,D-transpeptidase, partial [Chloroflexia bacterium]
MPLRIGRRVGLCFLPALLSVWALAGGAGLPWAAAQAGGRFYPQTGKTLSAEFVGFYDANGGLPIFGYPLTDAEIEGGFKVQYLERARIEYHPENAGTQYEVLLGLLGNILTEGRQFALAGAADRASGPGKIYFPETTHTLSGPFLSYWQRNGGLALFGYPISEPVQEGGYTVQYFE